MNKFYPLSPVWRLCKGIVKGKTGKCYVIATAIFVACLLSTSQSYAQYCLPAWAAPSCSNPDGDNFISAINFDNNNENGLGCPPVNYFDFSATTCFGVCTGNNYTVTLTPGYYATSNDEQFAVAIDFNGNGNFSDPGEFFFIGNSFLGSSITGVITIPPGVSPINTRMRVICQTVFGPSLTQNDVCGNNSTYGEAIDYCIQINATPQINLGGPYAQCGGYVSLDGTNPGPGTTYSWSDTSTTEVIHASTSGNYQVTVTSSAGCVGVSNATNVYIKPVPVVDLGPAISQCGGPATLDAGNTGMATYLWSNDSTGETVTVNSSGIYRVTATNINSGCTTTDSINVAIYGVPVINLGPSILQCGGTATLDAGNPGCTYLWSNGANTESITVSSTALYSVTVTTPNNCSASAAQGVTINPKPDIGPDISDSICPGNTVNLYSYYQNYAIPIFYDAANPAAVGPGVYVIIGTNDNGCTDTAIVSVTGNPKPNPGPNVTDSICPGAIIDLTSVFLDTSYSSYTWNTSDPKQAGIGNYTLIISNAFGCMDTVTANIINNELPVLNLALSQNICNTVSSFVLTQGSPTGGFYYIDGQPDGIFNPAYLGVGPHRVEYIYTSTSGCSDSIGEEVTIRPQPFITESLPVPFCTSTGPIVLDNYFTPVGGAYSGSGVIQSVFYPKVVPSGNDTIVDIYTDQYGCMDTSTVPLDINQAVQVSLTPSVADFTICQGQSITFTGQGAEDYQFFVNGAAQGATSTDNTFTTSSLTNHSEITVVGSNACSVDTSDIMIIDVIAPPAVNAGNDTTILQGQSVQLNGTATGSTPLIYLWEPGANLNFINIPNPTYSGPDSIAFWFKATDTYGCSDSSQINIYVMPANSAYTLPNVITPNGDGINDVWKLNPGIDLDGSHLVIFNRWGQTVYETENYANNWGGTYKTLTGEKLPDDTYYYVLKVPAEQNHVYEGAINILSSSVK